MTNKHAGQAIVDSLALHNVERVFVVPGESYLAVLDGLNGSSIDTVVCRHEGGVSPRELGELKAALLGASRPLLYIGGQRWTPAAATILTRFAEHNGAPVVQDWRAADRVPFDSPVNCGSLG